MFTEFPSIGQYRDIVTKIRKSNKSGVLPTVTFRGTVKLHGTNAAVGITGDQLWVQSRNNVITPEKDNCGFARFVSNPEVTSYFKSMCDGVGTLIVFGEWCGTGIQKGVAISELSKRFVIFAVKQDDTWVTDIERFTNPELNIWNILQFPTWLITIDFENPELSRNSLVEITTEVERQCPVAKYFGVEGIGEGVVWSSTDYMHIFKVKGEKHSVSHVKTLAPVDADKLASADAFVKYAVTENRMNQAIDVVFTQNGETPQTEKLGDVIKWVVNDIVKEESDTLEKSLLSVNDVKKLIAREVALWWKKK